MKLPQGWKLIDRMEVCAGDTIHTMAMEVPGPAVILCRSRTKLDTDRRAMPAVSEALVVLPDMALESFDYGNQWRLVSAKPIEYAREPIQRYREAKAANMATAKESLKAYFGEELDRLTVGQVIGSCTGAPQAEDTGGMLEDESEPRMTPAQAMQAKNLLDKLGDIQSHQGEAITFDLKMDGGTREEVQALPDSPRPEAPQPEEKEGEQK
jgi:hypothetical protein